jgi:hypothetical protein
VKLGQGCGAKREKCVGARRAGQATMGESSDQGLDSRGIAQASEAPRGRRGHLAVRVLEALDQRAHRAARGHPTEEVGGGRAFPGASAGKVRQLALEVAPALEEGGDVRERRAAQLSRVPRQERRQHPCLVIAEHRDRSRLVLEQSKRERL